MGNGQKPVIKEGSPVLDVGRNLEASLETVVREVVTRPGTGGRVEGLLFDLEPLKGTRVDSVTGG